MATLILDDVTIRGLQRRDLRRHTTRRVETAAWRGLELVAMSGPSEQHVQQVRELMRAGKSDRAIARRLGLERADVRAIIGSVISAAHLDDQRRVDTLAQQVGIADA